MQKKRSGRESVRTRDDPVYCAGCATSHPLPYCPLPTSPAGAGRSNDFPIPSHGDSLRQELTDVLYSLEAALALLRQERTEAGEQTVRDARNLLASILGTSIPTKAPEIL